MNLNEAFKGEFGTIQGRLILCNGAPMAFVSGGVEHQPIIDQIVRDAAALHATVKIEVRLYMGHPSGDYLVFDAVVGSQR